MYRTDSVKTANVFIELDTRSLLCDILKKWGYDPLLITSEDLDEVAIWLSRIAGKEPPWKWRYLRNVINEHVKPGKRLTSALLVAVDSVPSELEHVRLTTIRALGNVAPGSLILSDSRPCANPACPVNFVPRVPWQRFHDRRCRK